MEITFEGDPNGPVADVYRRFGVVPALEEIVEYRMACWIDRDAEGDSILVEVNDLRPWPPEGVVTDVGGELVNSLYEDVWVPVENIRSIRVL